MPDLTLINEKPVSLAEVKKLLEKSGKKLSYRGERTKDYIAAIAAIKPKEADSIAEDIRKLNIPRIKERHIAKILDLMPKDIDSIKAILSLEMITLKDEELQKIIGITSK